MVERDGARGRNGRGWECHWAAPGVCARRRWPDGVTGSRRMFWGRSCVGEVGGTGWGFAAAHRPARSPRPFLPLTHHPTPMEPPTPLNRPSSKPPQQHTLRLTPSTASTSPCMDTPALCASCTRSPSRRKLSRSSPSRSRTCRSAPGGGVGGWRVGVGWGGGEVGGWWVGMAGGWGGGGDAGRGGVLHAALPSPAYYVGNLSLFDFYPFIFSLTLSFTVVAIIIRTSNVRMGLFNDDRLAGQFILRIDLSLDLEPPLTRLTYNSDGAHRTSPLVCRRL
jgi:hypothetical protein